MHFYASWK